MSDDDLLLNRLMLGELDEHEAARILERLDTDDEFARRSAVQWRVHRLLALALVQADTADADGRLARSVRMAVMPSDASRVLAKRLASKVRMRHDRYVRRLFAPMAIAAVVLLSIGLFAIQRVIPRSSTTREAPPAIQVATITEPAANAEVEGLNSLRSATAGMRISSGETIHTTAGTTVIHLDDGGELNLQGECRLSAPAQSAHASSWHLDHGLVEAHITPRPPGSNFAIATPEAVATVVGTRFSLESGGGRSHLVVHEGVVRFAAGSGSGRGGTSGEVRTNGVAVSAGSDAYLPGPGQGATDEWVTPPANVSGWDLSWYEDFTAMDPTHFLVGLRSQVEVQDHQPLCAVLPGQVAVGRDGLVITAEAHTDPRHPYRGGAVNTAGTFAQVFGYFAVRAKLPSAPGVHPYVSLQGETEGDWLPLIDLIQSPGGWGGEGRKLFCGLHFRDAAGKPQEISSEWKSPLRLAEAWHTYGLWWRPESLTWYVDGQQIAQLRVSIPAVVCHLSLSCTVASDDGQWSGDPRQTIWPQRLQVAGVRVWRERH